MARQYAPAMTRQQFKSARPQGNYQSYLAFLQRKRPGWNINNPLKAQHVNPPTRGALPSYESMLRGLPFDTPAQMEARARRMAGNDYRFAQTAAQQAYKQAQDDAMRRMLAFQSAGRAAAQMNAGLIGQVGGEYQAGADQLSKLAAAGSASMSGATDAAVASANQATSNVGMPGVTVGGPVGGPGLAGPTQAGVENYRGGTLGAQLLQNAGGFAEAGMAGQIGAQNLRATQEAQAAYMSAVEQAQTAKAGALQEALAGRRSGIGDYLLKLQDAQRQQYALAMSMLEGRRGTTQEKFGRGVTKREQGREDTKLRMAQQAQAQQLRIAQEAARMQGAQIDMDKSIAKGVYILANGQTLKQNGKPIKVKPAVVAANVGGSSANVVTPYEKRQDAVTAANDWLYRHRDRRGNITGTKAQLVSNIMAATGVDRKLAQQIADSAYPKTVKGAKGNNPFATGG